MPESTSCTCHIPGPQEWPRSCWEGQGWNGDRARMGLWVRRSSCPYWRVGRKKQITTPIAGLWGMEGDLPRHWGADNLSQSGTPSGRRGEEHKRSPQLAPAATYPRVAAPSCTLLSFAGALARSRDTQEKEEGGPEPLLSPARPQAKEWRRRRG